MRIKISLEGIMKLKLIALLALVIMTGCGGGSPLTIEPAYDPPELASGHCPVMDQYYLMNGCIDCHGN